MTKTELKENITKINKLIRSGNYEGGIELAPHISGVFCLWDDV